MKAIAFYTDDIAIDVHTSSEPTAVGQRLSVKAFGETIAGPEYASSLYRLDNGELELRVNGEFIVGPEIMRKNTATLIPVTVEGIAAFAEVTRAYQGAPARLYGPMEDCSPEEPPEVEFDLYDANGYRAEWLEHQASQDELERVEEQIIIELFSE